MTPKEAVAKLREYIGGKRGVHHPGCNSSGMREEVKAEKCDCYAKPREMAHVAIDVLEHELETTCFGEDAKEGVEIEPLTPHQTAEVVAAIQDELRELKE